MALRDLNDDSDRLTTGLGRFADAPVYTDGNSPDYTTGGGGGVVTDYYTSYEDVTPTKANIDLTAAQPVVDVIPRVVAPEIKQTLQLPQFDFATGVASCTDCTTTASATDVVKTASAASLTTSVISPKVTPLPEGPKTINWLLIAAAAGIAYFSLKGNGNGLGTVPDAPEPVQTEQPLGRPPRKPAPKLKHVDSFKIK